MMLNLIQLPHWTTARKPYNPQLANEMPKQTFGTLPGLIQDTAVLYLVFLIGIVLKCFLPLPMNRIGTFSQPVQYRALRQFHHQTMPTTLMTFLYKGFCRQKLQQYFPEIGDTFCIALFHHPWFI